MILSIKQIQRIEYAVTVLLAALPSLHLLFNYPPLFNGTDSICFLNFPYSGVPHYPMFYPFYCSAFLKLLGDGPGFVYGIIIGQHIFYTLAVLYIAFYMRQFKRRILFLCCMFFAFRATMYIQGVYSEAWAIIAVGFIIGALLRICVNRKNTGNTKLHYGIYAFATVILLLSRFAGVFLIFILPFCTFLQSFYAKKLFNAATLKKLALQALLPVGLVLTAQLLTMPVLIFEHATDASLYGQPGSNSVSDAMNPDCTYAQPDKVLDCYKGATNDTLVKRTFEIIRYCNPGDIWGGVTRRIDSVRTDYISRGVVKKDAYTADGCLNAAFRIYLANPQYYPYKRLLPDIWSYFFLKKTYLIVSNDCNYLITTNPNSMPPNAPLLIKYLDTHLQVADYNKLNNDYLITEKGAPLTIPLLLFLMLIFKWRVKIPASLWWLFVSVTISGCLSHIITAIITTQIMRYIQPAEFMIYAMWCSVIAIAWPFNEAHVNPIEK